MTPELNPDIVEAIRQDAEHFPSFVKNRGREYAASGRVGPLELEGDRVAATVRGSQPYRTAWRWKNGGVDPICTCPVRPICKHTYALACVIGGAVQPVDDVTRARGRRYEMGERGRGFSAGAPRAAGSESAARAPADRPANESETPPLSRHEQRAAPRRLDPRLEQLRSAPQWERPFALARLVEDAQRRGLFLFPSEFSEILAEPDPDLRCWRLAQEIPKRAAGWLPPALEPWRDREDLAERALEQERVTIAQGLERWAKQRSAVAERSLRAVFGLERGTPELVVTLQVRATTPRLQDASRSPTQLLQLLTEVRRDPGFLAPPQARLLRLVAAGPLPGPFGDHRFELTATSLNRLLDSLTDSALATWGPSEDALMQAAGVKPGTRLRLEDATVDVVPAPVEDASGMRLALAARWADGRQRLLRDVVHVRSDDPLHPSLVVADGAFWRVREEPPADLLRKLEHAGELPVPREGRERFLAVLASSFGSVADALAPHTRVVPVRPVVTLDLDANDALHMRAFAHSGAEPWRPGRMLASGTAFELATDGPWERYDAVARHGFDELESAVEAPEATSEGAAADGATESVADTPAPDVPAPGEPGEASGVPAPGGVQPPTGDVWLETPDPHTVDSLRDWIHTLPLVPAHRRPVEGADDERGFWVRLDTRTIEPFAEAWEHRPAGVTWLGNRRMRDLLAGSRAVRPRVRVHASGVDWFSVSAEWEAEGTALTDADLARLRTARTRYVKLSSGWVRRDVAEAYDRAAELLADLGIEAGAGEQKISVWQLAHASDSSIEALETLGADASARREIERLRERIRGFEGLARIEVPAAVTAELRPYQREGLDFLSFVSDLGLGAILADDMGLGKTVQALAWLEHLREREPDDLPTLVVCPASVIHNWERESARFTPRLRVLSLTSGAGRHERRDEVPHHDLIVTNYALLRRDLEFWKTVELRAAILDEAQNVKNPDAAVSRAVLQLRAKHRLALTGTPLENRALDLWSLMHFVNPGYLGTRRAFVERFDRAEAPLFMRKLLAARLRPVLLRRLKQQVAPELPDRIEERRDCEMTRGQRQLYLAELQRARQRVERVDAAEGGISRGRIEILAALTRLRQVCCHPALIGGREALGSGKFEALFELLEPLLAEGHKVLLFSQFVECLELLRAEFERRGIRHHILTGSTRRRGEVVDAFEQDAEPSVFLISLRAGGTGLNLVSASYVVVFDPWWNPAVEAQAIDRTHRIGQQRTVIAYRMLTSGTVEERIYELQQRKAALARDVLGEEGFLRSLSREDLEYLLAPE